jgi:A/G-specific adenine glycosylase
LSAAWQSRLLDWYRERARPLPWRETNDPYAIWVSEVMLQQTQVATVIPYWFRWMERFPTVSALADASEDDVLGFWQGLGYYRRAKLLRHGAQFVVLNGMPRNAAEWLRVPSVGRYTAGAIASIALREPAALVDGNVERVFSRLFAIEESGSALHRQVWSLAEALVDGDDPGGWNQALMELGATVCRPVEPLCGECPVADACRGRAEGRTADLPRAEPKVAPVALRHVRWIPFFGDKVGLRRIENGPWWVGMWDFPRTESEGDVPFWVREGSSVLVGRFRHAVTNHRIEVLVYRVEVLEMDDGLSWFLPAELADLALPTPARRAWELANRPTLFGSGREV